jgi:hypothetical protein
MARIGRRLLVGVSEEVGDDEAAAVGELEQRDSEDVVEARAVSWA